MGPRVEGEGRWENADLGTTNPISSCVLNCNSHQSLRLDFFFLPGSAIEEISAGSRTLLFPGLREVARLNWGRLSCSSSVPGSVWLGGAPGQMCGPLGRSGPEFWSRSLVELLLLQESRAGREGFLGVAFQASAGSF